MLLLVNHQFIPISIRPKSISSIEQSCHRRSQAIVVTSLYCLLFLTPKNKDLKRIPKSAIIKISLDLKVFFSLATHKINNLIALRSTNQINEISAPSWLIEKLDFVPRNFFFMLTILRGKNCILNGGR